eukprot:2722952-Rhodomonas_salina.1
MYEKKKKAMGKWGISVLVGPNMGRTMVVAQESPTQPQHRISRIRCRCGREKSEPSEGMQQHILKSLGVREGLTEKTEAERVWKSGLSEKRWTAMTA